MLSRRLLPTDWPRLEYYAHKIQRLTIQPESLGKHATVDKSFFIALATYRPVRNPFQNLQQITIFLTHSLAYESAPYMDILLGPDISRVGIVVGPWASTSELSHVSLLLPSVPRLCPNLQVLYVDSTLSNLVSNKLDFERAIFQNIYSIHNLRTLYLETLKTPDGMIGRILHHLRSMTSLETLHNLHIPTEAQSLDKPDLILPPFGVVTLDHGFPKLRNLSLNIQDFNSAALVMDSMHLPFLSLAFYLEGQPSQPHSPGKLLQSLARNPHLPLSLSSILICEDVKQPLVRDVNDAETPSIFQPLLALTNLRKLTLQLSGVEMLDNAWLNRASKSFPQLQNLTLYGRDLKRKQITLAGYIPLLQNCPRLSEISIATAYRAFDPSRALTTGLCNENLRRLDCSESSIESPVASIFRCLILMFPNLSHLFPPSNSPSEGWRSWTDLQRLVRDSQEY